jgi:hypothetical protein
MPLKFVAMSSISQMAATPKARPTCPTARTLLCGCRTEATALLPCRLTGGAYDSRLHVVAGMVFAGATGGTDTGSVATDALVKVIE